MELNFNVQTTSVKHVNMENQNFYHLLIMSLMFHHHLNIFTQVYGDLHPHNQQMASGSISISLMILVNLLGFILYVTRLKQYMLLINFEP